MRILFLLVLGGLLFSQISLLAQTPEELLAKAVESGPLQGFRYDKHLSTGSTESHLLLFSSGEEERLVGWTSNNRVQQVRAPVSPGSFAVLDLSGRELERRFVEGYILPMNLRPEPRIFAPLGPNEYLKIAAAVERMPRVIPVLGPQEVTLECTFINPLNTTLELRDPTRDDQVRLGPGDRYTVTKTVRFGRPGRPELVRIGAMNIFQDVRLEARNPLFLDVWPRFEERLVVEIGNPAGDAVNGQIALAMLNHQADFLPADVFPLRMAGRTRRAQLEVPHSFNGVPKRMLRVQITEEDEAGYVDDFVLSKTPIHRFIETGDLRGVQALGDVYSYQIARSEGSSVDLLSGSPQGGFPWPEAGGLLVPYQFAGNGSFFEIQPTTELAAQIQGRPDAFGMWVRGDGSGNLFSIRFRDRTGRIFEPEPQPLDFSGWRWMTFELGSSAVPPLQWVAMARVTRAGIEDGGAIAINGPVLRTNESMPALKASLRRSLLRPARR